MNAVRFLKLFLFRMTCCDPLGATLPLLLGLLLLLLLLCFLKLMLSFCSAKSMESVELVSRSALVLRVVFPLRGPGKPPGQESPKNGEKILNFSPRSDPPDSGENCPKKGEKLLRKYDFCNFSVIFPHFRGSDRGDEFSNFSPFFGEFLSGRLFGAL